MEGYRLARLSVEMNEKEPKKSAENDVLVEKREKLAMLSLIERVASSSHSNKTNEYTDWSLDKP